MEREYYYVIAKNSDGTEELKGFNLTEEQKDKIFYSFKTPSGGLASNCRSGSGASNSYGCHKVLFKNKKQALNELVTKPNEFNNALKIIEKYGLMVVNKRAKVVSYQQMKSEEF